MNFTLTATPSFFVCWCWSCPYRHLSEIPSVSVNNTELGHGNPYSSLNNFYELGIAIDILHLVIHLTLTTSLWDEDYRWRNRAIRYLAQGHKAYVMEPEFEPRTSEYRAWTINHMLWCLSVSASEMMSAQMNDFSRMVEGDQLFFPYASIDHFSIPKVNTLWIHISRGRFPCAWVLLETKQRTSQLWTNRALRWAQGDLAEWQILDNKEVLSCKWNKANGFSFCLLDSLGYHLA